MQSLSETARVKIDEQTLEHYRGTLPLSKKQELRRQAIMAYIQRKPVGTRITTEEFQRVGHFNNTASVAVFIKRMLVAGLIERESLSPRTFCYKVVGAADGEVKVTTRRDPKRIKHTTVEIEQKAMEFSWKHPDKYDNLHAFIEWLKKETKDGTEN